MTQLVMENRSLKLFCDSTESAIKLAQSAQFKIRLRRYVKAKSVEEQDHTIHFQEDITIHEMKKIIETLKKIVPDIDIDTTIQAYIEERNYFINERYRLGNDIKKRSESVREEFKKFREIVDRQMTRPLTEEQLWNAFYMSVMKYVSNFSVPGSGKTATVLGTFTYYKEKDIASKIVMIGPKNAFGSWIDEYKVCFGITSDDFYLNIHDEELRSTDKRKYALQFESGSKELILVNYESVPSLVYVLEQVIDKKTLLVFDEIHKIKNPEGQRAAASKLVSENSGAIIALTGTPIPNSYVDIYNILNILYKEDYKDFFGFSINELKNAKRHEVDAINEKIKPFFCRISKEDLNVPPANKDAIIENEVTSIENELFKILYQTYRNNLFALLVRIYQLESNPELLLQKIDSNDLIAVIDDESDLAADITVKDYSSDITHLVNKVEMTTKTKATIELIKKLVSENKKTIVWCIFISSIKQLENLCKQHGIKVKCIYGEIALEDRLKLIDQFRNGEIDVLITNPHTLAESVSLHTVCHDAIYYEYSFNLVHLLQSKDRIHRLGLEDGQYTQYYFMNNYYTYNEQPISIADRIYTRLKEKEQTMLNAINNDILEHVTSYEEDLEVIFSELT